MNDIKLNKPKRKYWISNLYYMVGGLAVIASAYLSAMYGNPLITLFTGIALIILYSLLIRRYIERK